MKTFALTLNLKNDPQAIAKYKQHHQQVWPEVEKALKDVGVVTMKIFLLGRRMFMYIQTGDDFVAERDFARYLDMHPRCRQWDDLMCAFQEKVPEANQGEWWALMDQVYNLD